MWPDLQASSSLPTILTRTHTAKTATGSSPSILTTSSPWPSSGHISTSSSPPFFLKKSCIGWRFHQCVVALWLMFKSNYVSECRPKNAVGGARVIVSHTCQTRRFCNQQSVCGRMSSVLRGCTAAQFWPWNRLFCAAGPALTDGDRVCVKS